MADVPPVTKVTVCLTAVLSIVMIFLPPLETDEDSPEGTGSIKPLLAAVPAYCLFRPWTLLTAAFVETRIPFVKQ